MRKDEVTFHSDGFRERRPAVNVKVYDTLEDGFRKWAEEGWEAPRFTVEWIREHVSDEALDDLFWEACRAGFDDLEEEAREIWGSGVEVFSEGRMGGWAVVHGLDDFDDWDALALAKWARFARIARGEADYVMARVVELLFLNDFEWWSEEESERLGGEAFAPETMFAGVAA